MGPGFDGVEPEGRDDAHDEHEHDEGHERGHLAEAKIGCRLRCGERALRSVKKRRWNEPEHVGRAENDAERCGDGPAGG